MAQPWEQDDIVQQDTAPKGAAVVDEGKQNSSPWEQDAPLQKAGETEKGATTKPIGGFKQTANTAIDLVDMVAGYPAMLMGVGADIGARTIGALAGEDRRESAQSAAAISQKVSGYMSEPLRKALTAMGYGKDDPPSVVNAGMQKLGSLIEQGGEHVEKATGGAVLKEDVASLANELMALGPVAAAHPLQTAKNALVEKIAKYHTAEKIQGLAKEGATPSQTASEILKAARDKGIDTSSITQAHVEGVVRGITGEAIPAADIAAMKVDAAKWHKVQAEQEISTARQQGITPEAPTQMEIAFNKAAVNNGIKQSYKQLDKAKQVEVDKAWNLHQADIQLKTAGISKEQAFGYKNAQLGKIDKTLLIAGGLAVGGAAIGAVVDSDHTEGALLGAAAGLGLGLGISKIAEKAPIISPADHIKYKAAADVIHQVNNVIAASNPDLIGHETRVAGLSEKLANKLGLSQGQRARTAVGALGHDTAKLGMETLLAKQGPLTDVEKASIANHTVRGEKILLDMGVPEDIAKIAGQHHRSPTIAGKGDAPEFVSQIVHGADAVDSYIGGLHSGHAYPLHVIENGKSLEVPRTAANVLRALDDDMARGIFHPEVYKTLRKMINEGDLTRIQKSTLEQAGEVPWRHEVPAGFGDFSQAERAEFTKSPTPQLRAGKPMQITDLSKLPDIADMYGNIIGKDKATPIGQAFGQRGAIGEFRSNKLEDKATRLERQKTIDRELQKENLFRNMREKGIDLTHNEAGYAIDAGYRINGAGEVYNIKNTQIYKKQMGAVDKKLLISTGLVLGGAALGAYLNTNDTTLGLLSGAAFGFGLISLPKAGRAMSGNLKAGLIKAGTGAAMIGAGYLVGGVEGALVGSAIFGTRFLTKAKVHAEDDIFKAAYANSRAEVRLQEQVKKAMNDMIPDAKQMEEVTRLAEDPKFMGRTPEEKAVVETHRALMDSYSALAKDEGVKMGFIEAYVHHALEYSGINPSEAPAILRKLMEIKSSGEPGKSRATKERSYPTFAELEKAIKDSDLRIKTMNLAEIDYLYTKGMTRTIERQKVINAMKDAVDAQGNKLNWISDKQYSGYVPSTGVPQLIGKYIHPDIKPSLDFMFDNARHNDAVNAVMAVNRATKRSSIVGSFFHAGSLVVSYALAGGNIFKLKGDASAALKLYRDGGLGDRTDKLLRHSLNVEPPIDASVGALTELGKLADAYANKMTGSTNIKVASSVGKFLENKQKIFDKVTWDFLHPGLKLATAHRLMEEFDIGKDAKGLYKGMTEEAYMDGVSSHVNKSFGGLDWYQLASESKSEAGRKVAMMAFKPTSRDWLAMAQFAPDWTTSALRAAADALPGGAKNPANAAFAKRYAARTAVLYFTGMNFANYAMSGHFMWDNEGDKLRLDLGNGLSMQFMKHAMEGPEWVMHPKKTFYNKMGFVPHAYMMWQTGKQYPGGPPLETSTTTAIVSSAAPFALRNFSGPEDFQESVIRGALGAMSINIYGHTEEAKAAMREDRVRRKEETTAGMNEEDIKAYNKAHRSY